MNMNNNTLIRLCTGNANKRIIYKSLKQAMLLLDVSLCTKSKTHYETLGIAPTATYNEIKSAYYELTLRYHPDKNKSESAKVMFQEISNAYDILSKYDSRKQYDRTILIKQGSTYHKSEQMRKYQPMSSAKYNHTGARIYDFDTWLQFHYMHSFKKHKEAKERERQFQKKIEEDKNRGIHPFVMIALLTIAVTLSCTYYNIRESKYPSLKIVKSEK